MFLPPSWHFIFFILHWWQRRGHNNLGDCKTWGRSVLHPHLYCLWLDTSVHISQLISFLTNVKIYMQVLKMNLLCFLIAIFFPNYMQSILLSQIGLNTWLSKGKTMFFLSPWPSPRLVRMGAGLVWPGIKVLEAPSVMVRIFLARQPLEAARFFAAQAAGKGRCAPEYTREFTEHVRKTSPLWSALFDLVNVIPAPKSRRVLLWELGPASAGLSCSWLPLHLF